MRALWWLVLVLGCAPAAALVWGAAHQQLGPNPAQTLLTETGVWGVRLLCAALAVTPARVLLGWPALARLRRVLGLLAFAYAALHTACYAVFDMGLVAADMAADALKRPLVQAGWAAMLLLCALAATSFDRAIRALGGKRWRALHRSVYAAAVLVVAHHAWVKGSKNLSDSVWLYGTVLAALLGWRVWHWARERARKRSGPRAV